MRVATFVDVSNLWYCLSRKFPGGKLNYQKLYGLAESYGELLRATAYGQQVRDEAEVFIACLHKIGYRTRYKEVRQEDSTKWLARKSDWDVGIAVDVVRVVAKVDAVVLCTSSATFAPLLKWLQDCGIRTIVIGCGVPRELKDHADDWTEIGEDFLEVGSAAGPE